MGDDASHQERVAAFLAELKDAIDLHKASYRWDTFWYQFLVVGSAVAGILSLVFGMWLKQPALAGAFGGLTTIATVLSQTLHCVRAQAWQARMKTEIDGIRLQLVYEHGSSPTPDGLTNLSQQLRALRLRMTEEWEKIISVQPSGFGSKQAKKKSLPEGFRDDRAI